MATVKVIIRSEKTKKNGEVPLYIRMTRDRKSSYISLKQSLLPKHWDADQQRVRKSHPNAGRLNALIAQKKAEIEALALDVTQGSKQVEGQGIRKVLAGGSSESFLEFADQFLTRLKAEERHGTHSAYESNLKCLRNWLLKKRGKTDLSFAELDRKLVRQYREYLEKERGNKPNTIKLKFATMKSVISYAQEKELLDDSYNPFAGQKIKHRRTKKVIPTIEELALIAGAELHPGSNMEQVRDLYLFSANMAGLRFSDAVSLRWAQVDGTRLRWQTQKTAKQRLVYIPQAARDIIARYDRLDREPSDFVFPLLRGLERVDGETLYRKINVRNINANATLRRICKLAGLDRSFSFHTSRHYFATDSLRKGMRVEVLQHLLTHSKLDQTMEYVEIVNEDMDAAMMAYEAAQQG